MKLRRLTIGPKFPYRELGADNPYQAKVFIATDEVTIETLLPDDTAQRIIEMVRQEIVAGAKEQMDLFVADSNSAAAIEHIDD